MDVIKSKIQTLRLAFRTSIPMVYLNFLPREWLPSQDKGYMRSLFNEAKKLEIGAGGSDLMPYRKSHMAQTYSFFKEYPDILVKGMAIQHGNRCQINPKTGKRNTVADVLNFSRDYLGLDYIFWAEDEPYFINEVMQQLPY